MSRRVSVSSVAAPCDVKDCNVKAVVRYEEPAAEGTAILKNSCLLSNHLTIEGLWCNCYMFVEQNGKMARFFNYF